MADKEIALDREEPAEIEKQTGKAKKETDGATLPVLIEFTVTFSVIFLVLMFFTIVGISFVTGTSLLAFVFRTSISILLIGGLLVIITRQIYFGMFSSEAVGEEKSEQKLSDEHPIVEMPGTLEAK